MQSHVSQDIFTKDLDAFFNDLRDEFSFLNASRGGFLGLLFKRKPHKLNQADCKRIENLIYKHYGDSVIFKDTLSRNEFADAVFKTFEPISDYYARGLISADKCIFYMQIFLLILANYYQLEYTFNLEQKSPKRTIYLDKYGNIIEFDYDVDLNAFRELSLEELPYKNAWELMAHEVEERIVYYYTKLPNDKVTEDLIFILLPLLPLPLSNIILPDYRQERTGTTTL